MPFSMRTTKPEKGNKYYNTKANGGYSDAIKGKPVNKDCDVLSNCVGYAYGRFNEIGKYGYCKYLRPVNAEKFIEYRGSLEVGNIPKVGAVMVWKKGQTLNGDDGAGHVAIVEKVIDENTVYTSESNYGAEAFINVTRKKGSDGRWGKGSSFTFRGFIYNPAVKDDEPIKKEEPDKKETTPTNKNYYVVKTGDTVSSIAKKYGTTVSVLKSLNSFSNIDKIYTGQKIVVPAEKNLDDIAKEVIAGKWGSGLARKTALKKAGYDPSEVQKIVNKLLK